jgi:hypothetical protein
MGVLAAVDQAWRWQGRVVELQRRELNGGTGSLRWIRDAVSGRQRYELTDILGGPEPGTVLQECERTDSGCTGLVSGAQECGGPSTRDRRLSRILLGIMLRSIDAGLQ